MVWIIYLLISGEGEISRMLLFKKGDELVNETGEHSVNKKEKEVQAQDALNG